MNVRDGPLKVSSWVVVLKALKEYFLPCDSQNHLRDQLEQLKQGDDMSRYLVQVRSLCSKIEKEMKDEEIMRHLYRGMDPNIAREVYKKSPKTSAELEKIAKNVEASNRLFPTSSPAADPHEIANNVLEGIRKISLDRGAYAPKSPIPPRDTPYGGTRDYDRPRMRVHFNKQGAVPDTNATRTTFGTATCFICEKAGHFARSCPQKSSRYRRETEKGNASYGQARYYYPQNNRGQFRNERDREIDRARNMNYYEMSQRNRNPMRQDYHEIRDKTYWQKQPRAQPSQGNPGVRFEKRVNHLTVHRISVSNEETDGLIYADILVEEMGPFKGLVDTGSEVTLIAEKLASECNLIYALDSYQGAPVISSTDTQTV